MNKEYFLTIGDDTYHVASDESEVLVKKAAERVQGAMVQAMNSSLTVSSKKAAVLVALQCANEMQKIENYHAEITRSCQQLIDAIDEILIR